MAIFLVTGLIHGSAAISARYAARIRSTMSSAVRFADGENAFATYACPTASPKATFVASTQRFQRGSCALVPFRMRPRKAKFSASKRWGSIDA